MDDQRTPQQPIQTPNPYARPTISCWAVSVATIRHIPRHCPTPRLGNNSPLRWHLDRELPVRPALLRPPDLIPRLHYTKPKSANALQISLLSPPDTRPEDIVICISQPGIHWEARPRLTGRPPTLGESFNAHGTSINPPTPSTPIRRRRSTSEIPTDSPRQTKTGPPYALPRAGPRQPPTTPRLRPHRSSLPATNNRRLLLAPLRAKK